MSDGEQVQQQQPSESSSESSSISSKASSQPGSPIDKEAEPEQDLQTERTPFKPKESSNNILNHDEEYDTPKKSYRCTEEVSVSTKYLPNSGKMIQSSQIIDGEKNAVSMKRMDIASKTQLFSMYEISHAIDYNGEFEDVKKLFTEISQKRKLHVMRETNNIVIVKKEPSYSYQCFFSLCLPFSDEGAVYQLKNYPTRHRKAKIILISGDFETFDKFRKDLCCQLWQSKQISANQADAVDFFFHSNRANFDFISQECSRVLTKKKKQTQQHAMGLLKVLKDSEANLKRRMSKFEGISYNPSAEKRLEQLIFSVVQMANVYEKVFQIENSELYTKKQQILNNYTLNELFDHLEIEKQYRLITEQTPLSLSLTPQRQSLPYYPAIQLLESLQSTNAPSTNIQLASVFCHRLRTSCSERSHMVKLIELDMDSLLPLTIYCVALCQNQELLPVCKMMLEYMEQEDNCESEKKIFTSIQASLEFIRAQWKDYSNKKTGSQRQRI